MKNLLSLLKNMVITAVVGASVGLVPHVNAQEVEFSGQTVEFWMPFAEGGGSDVWARFLAPYLSEYLPGQPSVIVRNIPGGGSITGTNEFAARARPDGLTIIGTSASTQIPYLLGDSRVRYDYNVLEPVFLSPAGAVVYISPKFGITDASELDQLGDTELVFGSLGVTSLDLVPLLAFEVLGLNVRHVFGMTGRGEGRLAFERGEATIDYQNSSAYLASVQSMVDAGEAVPLFSLGVLDSEGNVQRDPTFPDLPHFVEAYEMMHGELPTGIEFDAYMALFGLGLAAQKPALLPEGTPSEIVDAWRQAFVDVVNDPEFQANSKEVLGDYQQAVGDDVDKLYRIATNVAPETRDWVREYLSENYQVSFD